MNEVVSEEKKRVTQLLDDTDRIHAQSAGAISRLIELLKMLKEEIGEVPSIEFRFYDTNAIITVRSSGFKKSCWIGVNLTWAGLIKFQFSTEKYGEREVTTCETEEEVMEKVINFVGKHIGDEQAKSSHKFE